MTLNPLVWELIGKLIFFHFLMQLLSTFEHAHRTFAPKKIILNTRHTAKDPRFWSAAKPHSDTLARLYGLVRGYPEVIGTQLPVIRAQ